MNIPYKLNPSLDIIHISFIKYIKYENTINIRYNINLV